MPSAQPKPEYGEARAILPVAESVPFKAREFPGVPEHGRDYDHLIDQRITDLSQKIVPAVVPPLFRPFAEVSFLLGATRNNQNVTVASIGVPPSYRAVQIILQAALNDAVLDEAVQFTVFYGNKQIGQTLNGGTSRAFEIGIMPKTRNGSVVHIEAFVLPAFWTTGATPFGNLIRARVALEVLCLMNERRHTP